MTPPAFARMSGRINLFLFSRILSASGVVGPFASSKIIFAFIWFAFFSVIWFARAAGTKISQSNSNNCSFVMSVVFEAFGNEPVCFLCSRTSFIFSPSGL